MCVCVYTGVGTYHPHPGAQVHNHEGPVKGCACLNTHAHPPATVPKSGLVPFHGIKPAQCSGHLPGGHGRRHNSWERLGLMIHTVLMLPTPSSMATLGPLARTDMCPARSRSAVVRRQQHLPCVLSSCFLYSTMWFWSMHACCRSQQMSVNRIRRASILLTSQSGTAGAGARDCTPSEPACHVTSSRAKATVRAECTLGQPRMSLVSGLWPTVTAWKGPSYIAAGGGVGKE